MLLLLFLVACNQNKNDSISSFTQSTTGEIYTFDISGTTNSHGNNSFSITLPTGLYYKDASIWQDPVGTVPDNIYKPRGDGFKKIGGIYSGLLSEDITVVDEKKIISDYWAMDSQEIEYSDDANLPGNTFYRYKDGYVVTYESLAEGDGILLKSTHYMLPVENDTYICIWFLHNSNSTNAKEYFESIVSSLNMN